MSSWRRWLVRASSGRSGRGWIGFRDLLRASSLTKKQLEPRFFNEYVSVKVERGEPPTDGTDLLTSLTLVTYNEVI